MMIDNKRPDAETVGKNIARLRKEKGMTQQELADILGVTNKTVSKWECGRGLPDVTQFPHLEEIFAITRDALYFDQAPDEDTAVGRRPTSRGRKVAIAAISAATAAVIVAVMVLAVLLTQSAPSDHPLPPPDYPVVGYDIDGIGSFVFEAEKSKLSDGLIVMTDGGSGHGYVGNFDGHDGASMTFSVRANGNYFAGLYFCLSPRGITDICTETYTVELNGGALTSRTVFRDADQGWTHFNEYFIAGVDLTGGLNVLKITFHANELGNNGHNFDYVRFDTRYVASGEEIFEAEESEFSEGLAKYYDAGSGLGYLGRFDQNDGAAMTFRYNAPEQCERLLYMCCVPRARNDAIANTYTVTVNGEAIASNGIIYGKFASWTDFREYFVGNVKLRKGENLITFTFHLDKVYPNNGHNFDYIRFVDHKVAEMKEEGTTVLEAEESLYDPRLQPMTAGETVYLGNFDICDSASMAYVFNAPAQADAELVLRCVPRGQNVPIADIFDIKINGRDFVSTEIIGGEFVSWTSFETYNAGKIRIEEGVNEIILTFKANAEHNNGHNFDYIGLIVGREE